MNAAKDAGVPCAAPGQFSVKRMIKGAGGSRPAYETALGDSGRQRAKVGTPGIGGPAELTARSSGRAFATIDPIQLHLRKRAPRVKVFDELTPGRFEGKAVGRVSRIRMDAWSRGRVGSIGDAAFCVSLLPAKAPH